MSRKSIAQAEEVKRNIFGLRLTGDTANFEQGEDIRASASRAEQQGNETLNNGHDTTVQTQPQVELEEIAL